MLTATVFYSSWVFSFFVSPTFISLWLAGLAFISLWLAGLSFISLWLAGLAFISLWLAGRVMGLFAVLFIQ
jgi:hypothetical protein